MNELQISEIKNYLKSKNLSRDLFIEVFDHFAAQVADLMKSNQMQFQTAFLEAKKNW